MNLLPFSLTGSRSAKLGLVTPMKISLTGSRSVKLGLVTPMKIYLTGSRLAKLGLVTPIFFLDTFCPIQLWVSQSMPPLL